MTSRWAEDHVVVQYLDGCWYVVDNNEYMMEEGLMAGPFVNEEAAWVAHYQLEQDWYEECAEMFYTGDRDWSEPYEP